LSARYSELRGEVLNLGTLINPVYSTLNQLLQAQAFPTNIDLRLPQQRETKATLLQPVFHPEILYNYRIHAKLRDAEAAHKQAFKRQLVAGIKTAYFNYAKTVRVVELYRQEAAQNDAKVRREEFQQLRVGIGAAEAAVKVHTSSFLPNLSLGVDYGFQGNEYDFGANQDYLVVSLVAQWNIFNGFQDAARRQQASLEVSRLRTQLDELENQIALQVRITFNDAAVAKAAIATANDRLASAQKSFALVAKKYAQGAAAQVEYIDARTAFTNAGINQIITAYDYYIKYAQLERAAGLYPIDDLQNER
jgi:outer membrane protein TolC